jgi:hypothetical protein
MKSKTAPVSFLTHKKKELCMCILRTNASNTIFDPKLYKKSYIKKSLKNIVKQG